MDNEKRCMKCLCVCTDGHHIEYTEGWRIVYCADCFVLKLQEQKIDEQGN